ncbi:MAG: hypothetical protein ACREQ2_13810 [Candidatus Binatia bacterium]
MAGRIHIPSSVLRLVRSNQELKPLRVLAEEKQLKRYLCVSLEPRARRVDGVSVLPLSEFLEALWSGEYT